MIFTGELHVAFETAKGFHVFKKCIIMFLDFYFVFQEKLDEFTQFVLLYVFGLSVALPMKRQSIFVLNFRNRQPPLIIKTSGANLLT